MWQKGELENITLDLMAPSEEEELDEDGEPIVKYESEEEYKLYVLLLRDLSNDRCDHLVRRIKNIEIYYVSLGVEVLFKQHPKLEQYLTESFDDKLVAKVCICHSLRCPNADISTVPDVECCEEPAWDAHQLRETGGIAVPSPIYHTAAGQCKHPTQLGEGRPGNGAQGHCSIPNSSPASGGIRKGTRQVSPTVTFIMLLILRCTASSPTLRMGTQAGH